MRNIRAGRTHQSHIQKATFVPGTAPRGLSKGPLKPTVKAPAGKAVVPQVKPSNMWQYPKGK